MKKRGNLTSVGQSVGARLYCQVSRVHCQVGPVVGARLCLQDLETGRGYVAYAYVCRITALIGRQRDNHGNGRKSLGEGDAGPCRCYKSVIERDVAHFQVERYRSLAQR